MKIFRQINYITKLIRTHINIGHKKNKREKTPGSVFSLLWVGIQYSKYLKGIIFFYLSIPYAPIKNLTQSNCSRLNPVTFCMKMNPMKLQKIKGKR
jgi:hypothetical protein